MKILIVDDEYVALSKMTTLLSKYGDCKFATDGKQALKLFDIAVADEGHPYDLITIDIDMPKIDGLELLKIISQKEQNRNISRAKKIIISAENSADNVLQAVQNHCDAFIAKPVLKRTLVDKLKEIGITP